MDFKLKLKSKKLDSGRFQVNFSTEGFVADYYGYMLTEPQTSVRTVVEKIQKHVSAMSSSDKYFQPNLFSLDRRKREVNSGRVMIFRRDAVNEGASVTEA